MNGDKIIENGEVENAKPSGEISYGKIVVIKRTGQDSASFELIDESYTFGRAVDCDIRIQLMNIAEEHVKICRNEHGQAVLLKLSEDGGVSVNNSQMKEPSRLLGHNDIFTLVERSFRYEFTPEMLARHQLIQSHGLVGGAIPLTMETPKKASSLSGSVFSISEVPSSPATPKTPVPVSRASSVSISSGASPKIPASPMGSAVVDSEITTSPKLSPKVVKMADGDVLASVTPFNIVGASSLGMSVVSSTDHHAEFDKENICEIVNMEITCGKDDEVIVDNANETVTPYVDEAGCVETEAAVVEELVEAECDSNVVEMTVEPVETEEMVESEVAMTEEPVEITKAEDASEKVMTESVITEEPVEVTEVIECESTEVVCENIAVACGTGKAQGESIDAEMVESVVETTETAVDDVVVEAVDTEITDNVVKAVDAEMAEAAVETVDTEMVDNTDMVVADMEAIETTDMVVEASYVCESAESNYVCESAETYAEPSPSACDEEAADEHAEERETFESVEMPLTQEHHSHEYNAPSFLVAPVETEIQMQTTESESEVEHVSEIVETGCAAETETEAVAECVAVSETAAVKTATFETESTTMEASTPAVPSSTISSFVCAYESSEINSMEETATENVAAEIVENVEQCDNEAVAFVAAENGNGSEAPEASESAIMPVMTESETVETDVVENVSEAVEPSVSDPSNLDVSIEIDIPAVQTVKVSEIASIEIESVEESLAEPSTPGPLRKSTRVHLTPAALESVKKQHDQSDSPVRSRSGRSRDSEDSGDEENSTLSEANENANNNGRNTNSEKRTSARTKKAKLDSPVTPVRRSARARVIQK